MATSPETRQQAIDIMTKVFTDAGQDPGLAPKVAEKIVDQAIAEREGSQSDADARNISDHQGSTIYDQLGN